LNTLWKLGSIRDKTIYTFLWRKSPQYVGINIFIKALYLFALALVKNMNNLVFPAEFEIGEHPRLLYLASPKEKTSF